MSASAPFNGSTLADAENPFSQLLTKKREGVRWAHSGIFWAWGTFLGLLMLTGVAYYHVKSDTENDARQQFSNRSAEVVQAIQNRMVSYTETLQGGLGLFRASSHVDRSEFRAYVSTLNISRKLPGIQGLGYTEWVKPSARAAYERRVRKDGFPTFKIRPPGKRELYSSITYLEPFDERNKKAFGYDMYSQETRRLAMERARDTGDVAISGKVTLVQENASGVQAGFLMYTPFYGPMDPGTIAERRRESRGFIYSAFRMEDLMKGILGLGSADVRLQIFDEGQPTSDSLMFDSAPETGHNTPAFVAIKIVTIGQRDWMIQTSSLPPFERFLDPQKTYIVLAAGILTSALIFSVLWSFANTRRRAQDIASRITVSLNEATQQANDRQARISAVVETVVDGIITIDNRGKIETFNRAAEKIFGYTSNEVTGQNVKTLMPQSFRDEHDSYLHNYRETGDAQVIGNDREVIGLRKDGTTFPMDLAIGEMVIDGRQMFTGIVRDISERKQIEQMRNEATQQASDRQARISAVLETVVDGIITIDNRGKIETFNRAAEKIFGYTSTEITGINVKSLMPAPFREEHDGYLKNYRETGDAQVIGNDREVVGRRKDGTTFPMDLAIGEMVIDGQQMFTGIVRDISERKEIERMKNEFVSTVSHELRTPLTSMMGSLGLLKADVLGEMPEQTKAMLDIAHKNGQRLINLLNDILDVEKMEAGKLEYVMKPLEILPLMENAIEANLGYGDAHGVTFILGKESSAATVQADEARMMQVMSNLMSNAAKYSAKGDEVEISVTTTDDSVRVAVADKGPGIRPEHYEKIFKKFSQADSSDNRAKDGTGLGLSITKSIVESHGGRIDFTSEVDKGTTFFFELPLCPIQSSNKVSDKELETASTI